jgi:hypothetical protein
LPRVHEGVNLLGPLTFTMEEPFLVGSTPRFAPLRSYADSLIIWELLT